MEAATDALDEAYHSIFPHLEAGVSEQEISRKLRASILLSGADQVGYTNVSNATGNTLSSPSPRTFTDGDIAYLDGGAFVRGYCCDHNRLVSLGEPSRAAQYAYRALFASMEAGVAVTRAGIDARSVAAEMYRVLEESGVPAVNLGRVGHGNGLEMPEPPSLHAEDRTLLQAGMVLSIEPHAYVPDVGLLMLEDMVAIEEEGARVLSKRPTTPELLPAVPISATG